MTKNAYGVEASINVNEFNDWEWGDYGSTADIIKAISIEAAKVVMEVIADRGQLGIYSGKKGCGFRVWLGDDIGQLSAPFSVLIDQWIDVHGAVGDEAAPLIAALEDALARVKAVA